MSSSVSMGMMAPVSRSSGSPSTPQVVPAVRSRTSGWRDPRLWIGVAIVAVSVVAGARFLAAADDTVQVWAVATDLGAGDRVAEADLVAHRVRFDDDEQLGGYFTVEEELPADLELTRGVGAGELLPRGAVDSAGATGTLELPVAVDLLPTSVGPGSVVDVHVTGAGPARASSDTGPTLSEVTVVDVAPLDASLAAGGKRQLVLAVQEDEAARWFEALGAAERPTVTVLGRS